MKKSSYILIAAIVAGLLLIAAAKKDETKITKELIRQYVKIPEGIAVIGEDSVQVPAIRLGKTEVTNGEYLAFLSDLKAQGKDEMYKKALPDTTAWDQLKFAYTKYVRYYLRHEAYADYPVVNVSHEGAQMYCRWLTERYNAENQGETVVFRLPTRAEWLRAAQAGNHHRQYAWENPFLQNEKGEYLANFRTIRNSQISESSNNGIDIKSGYHGLDHDLNAEITAPAKSYQPGVAGLYNLNGNVAEMVAEAGLAVGGSFRNYGYDIRNEATMEFDAPSPTVGFRVLMEDKQK